jgi:hypothetical protein
MIFLLLPMTQGAVSAEMVIARISLLYFWIRLLINLTLFVKENYRPLEGAQAALKAGGTHPINEHPDL